MRPTSRVLVYEAIDGERDYQDNLGMGRTAGLPRTVGDELVLLDYLMTEAKDAWVEYPGNQNALEQIRKIAAVAVRALEQNGVPTR